MSWKHQGLDRRAELIWAEKRKQIGTGDVRIDMQYNVPCRTAVGVMKVLLVMELLATRAIEERCGGQLSSGMSWRVYIPKL